MGGQTIGNGYRAEGGLAGPGGRVGMGMIPGNPIAGHGATIGGPGIPIHHPACENGATGRKTPFPGIPASPGNPHFPSGPRASPPMGLFRGETSLVAVEGPEPGSGIGDRGSDEAQKPRTRRGLLEAVRVTGLALFDGSYLRACPALIVVLHPDNPCTALSGRMT